MPVKKTKKKIKIKRPLSALLKLYAKRKRMSVYDLIKFLVARRDRKRSYKKGTKADKKKVEQNPRAPTGVTTYYYPQNPPVPSTHTLQIDDIKQLIKNAVQERKALPAPKAPQQGLTTITLGDEGNKEDFDIPIRLANNLAKEYEKEKEI